MVNRIYDNNPMEDERQYYTVSNNNMPQMIDGYDQGGSSMNDENGNNWNYERERGNDTR